MRARARVCQRGAWGKRQDIERTRTVIIKMGRVGKRKNCLPRDNGSVGSTVIPATCARSDHAIYRASTGFTRRWRDVQMSTCLWRIDKNAPVGYEYTYAFVFMAQSLVAWLLSEIAGCVRAVVYYAAA